MKKYLPILVILSIIFSEIIIQVNAVAGFLLYSVLITGILIVFSRIKELDNQGKLVIVLMILPISRIAELFLNFDFFYRTIVFYYILLFLVVYYSFKFKMKLYSWKNTGYLPLAIIFGISAGFLGNSLFGLGKLSFLAFMPAIAFSEEVLFRGLIQNLVKENYGTLLALVTPGIIYAFFSLSYGFKIMIFFFAINLILSIMYNYTRNIYLTIAVNFITGLLIFATPKLYP